MPKFEIPLFLSNDPEMVDNVSDDGSQFTVRLQPPIFIPARKVDGSNVMPTISARSIDIVNSLHNVSVQHNNHVCLISDGTHRVVITIPNGTYSLDELATEFNARAMMSIVSSFTLQLSPLNIKNRVQLTLGDPTHELIVDPSTSGLSAKTIAGFTNTTCKQTINLSISCHSFNFVDKLTNVNVLQIPNHAMVWGNPSSDMVVTTTFPNSNTSDSHSTSWKEKNVGIRINGNKKIGEFNKKSLSTIAFITHWPELETKINNALSYLYQGHDYFGSQPIPTLMNRVEAKAYVFQDAIGNFLGVECYLRMKAGQLDNMVPSNQIYNLCYLEDGILGSSELICLLNDQFDSEDNASHIILGSKIEAFKFPHVSNDFPTQYVASDAHYNYARTQAFVHVSSASRLMDINEDTTTKYVSNFVNIPMNVSYFYFPYTIGFGNEFGKMLGLYTVKDKKFTLTNIGGGYSGGATSIFIASGAAQLDHASTLHLSCSIASGSVGSDGRGHQGIICSWPMSDVALGAHASIMYHVPIKVPCRCAGVFTDRLTFHITDVVGERPHLSGERLLCTVVIEYET